MKSGFSVRITESAQTRTRCQCERCDVRELKVRGRRSEKCGPQSSRPFCSVSSKDSGEGHALRAHRKTRNARSIRRAFPAMDDNFLDPRSQRIGTADGSEEERAWD